jgi:hypothetical protein
MLLKRFSGLCLLALLACVATVQAQELFCRLTINSSSSGLSDKSIVDQLQQQMQDFMNLRRRTSDQFAQEERIICNIALTIRRVQGTSFESTAQISCVRPIYGTSLETVLLNYTDPDFNFDYSPGQPMEFNEQSPAYTDNITSLLSYYAFLIIGIDYDSYRKLGGKTYFLLAQQIAQNASSSQYKGWKPFEGTNNRNWLIENYMNQQLIPFREGCYNYYRLGLDKFEADPDNCRAQVLDLLTRMQGVLQVKPLCIAINTFLDTKSTEIINILSKGQMDERQRAYNILVQIDPTKTDRYQKLIN